MKALNLKEILQKVQIKQIALPLGYMLLMSIAYNIVYLVLLARITDTMVYNVAQSVLSLISSVGFYWLCTVAWKKERALNFKSILYVLLYQVLALIVVIGIMANLDVLYSESVIVQVVGALCIFFIIPVQLVYFYAVSDGIYAFKEIMSYIGNVFKRHSRAMLNWFCIALIVVLAVDSFIGGIFSIGSGINTCSILTGMFLYGNPMMNWMMTVFMASINGISIINIYVIEYLILYFVIGLWYGVLYMNYIVYIQRKCLDNGIKTTKANKKKNRTSK